MKTALWFIGMLLLWGCTVALGQDASQPSQKSQNDTLVVIINEVFPLGEELTARDIKDIYLGKKQVYHKVRLLPTNRSDETLQETFLQAYVGKSVKQFRNYWRRKVFSRGGQAPEVFDDLRQLIAYIADNEGAIGYAWKHELSGKEKHIRVLTVATEEKK
ncbi:MAG: hypothetical protein D6681_15205 [Calditrichaeota bacterium]|nr:MAG: hypothetical protein D6681_15205 [Calditrichota bacterium]